MIVYWGDTFRDGETFLYRWKCVLGGTYKQLRMRTESLVLSSKQMNKGITVSKQKNINTFASQASFYGKSQLAWIEKGSNFLLHCTK